MQINNQLLGIVTIVFCSIIYFFSWKQQEKNNFQTAVVLLMMAGLFLRIFTSLDFFLHDWDERYHALVAKHLIDHPFKPTLYENPILSYDFQNWTGNYIWLHKQPLPLWFMAASMWLLGSNEIALRLPSIILTTIGIGLTYSIGNYLFNKRIGFLAAFFYSFNGLIIEIASGRTGRDHVDAFFLFFVELAIFFTIKFAQNKKIIFNLFAGIGLGAAVLSKWLPAFIVLPIWLLVIIDSKHFNSQAIVLQFVILIMTSIMIFLPWQVYIHLAFPLESNWESSMNIRHVTQVVEEHGGAFYYYIIKIGKNYGELIYLPLAWFLWQSLRNINDFKRLIITLWFVLPFIFFSAIATKMQAYILFISPALFFMIAVFWYESLNSSIIKPIWLRSLILLLILALPIRYTIERSKPFSKTERYPEWVQDLKRINRSTLKSNVILFNYLRPIEAMFYTNFIVYRELTSKSVVDSLTQSGYNVIINDNGRLTEETKTMKDVSFVKLTEPVD